MRCARGRQWQRQQRQIKLYGNLVNNGGWSHVGSLCDVAALTTALEGGGRSTDFRLSREILLPIYMKISILSVFLHVPVVFIFLLHTLVVVSSEQDLASN